MCCHVMLSLPSALACCCAVVVSCVSGFVKTFNYFTSMESIFLRISIARNMRRHTQRRRKQRLSSSQQPRPQTLVSHRCVAFFYCSFYSWLVCVN